MLALNHISSIEQLAKYVPELRRLHASLDGKWEPELNEDEFVARLVSLFGPNDMFYAQLDDSGELIYFISIYPTSDKALHFWLFYMNPAYRHETKPLIAELISIGASRGYEVCYTSSTRTESSYERWLEKFGAQKVSITYKIPLH